MRRLRPVGERVPLAFFGVTRNALRDASDAARSEMEQRLFHGYQAHWYGSGTAALAAAIKAAIDLKKPRGRAEVILPAYACPDIVSAVLFAGARPVLADLIPNLPWLDPRSAADIMTPDTVAIVYVRFLGLPANDRSLRALVAENGPLLIEDAAHHFPLDAPVRSAADLVVLSFGRGKPVSLRRGGVLLQRCGTSAAPFAPPRATDAGDSLQTRFSHWLSCALYNLAVHPQVYGVLTRIAPSQFDAIRFQPLRELTALPKSLFPLLTQALARHRQAGAWRQQLLSSMLSEIGGPWMDVPRHAAVRGATESSSAFPSDQRLWRYPLLLSSEVARDRLFTELWRGGLGPSRMYCQLLSEMPPLSAQVRATATPNARSFSQRLLTLPVHSDVRAEDYSAIHARLESHTRLISASARAGRATPLHESIC